MHSLIKEQQTARFADRPCCMQTSWVAVMHYQTHIKTYAGTQRQQNPETEVGQANQLGLATFKKCNGVPLFRIRYDGCKGTWRQRHTHIHSLGEYLCILRPASPKTSVCLLQKKRHLLLNAAHTLTYTFIYSLCSDTRIHRGAVRFHRCNLQIHLLMHN